MIEELLLPEDSNPEEPAVVVYLLGDILNDFNLSMTEEEDQDLQQFIEV